MIEPSKMYGCVTTGFFAFLPESVGLFLKRENDFVMNDNKDKWLHIRISASELQTINDQFSESASRKRSDFLRKQLLGKPITIKYRNKSLDDFVSEMVQLKNELNAIGHNFNQTVKRLHTLSHVPEILSWAVQNEKHKLVYFQKVEEIKQHMIKMAEQWSQESAPVKV